MGPRGNLSYAGSVTQWINVVKPGSIHAYYLFIGGDSVKTVTIPAGTTEVPDRAFDDCRSLDTVIISDGVNRIGKYAFAHCRLKHVQFGSDVTEIGSYAFEKNKITSLHLPEGLRRIGAYSFMESSNLSDVVIPSTVEYIGWIDTFYYESGATDLDEGGAFEDCSKLVDVYMKPSTKPVMDKKSFRNNNKVRIHVPCGSATSYNEVNSWGSSFILIEDGNRVVSIKSNNNDLGKVNIIQRPTCSSPVAVFEAEPKDGGVFVGWSDGVDSLHRTVPVADSLVLTAFFDVSSGIEVQDGTVLRMFVNDGKVVVDGANCSEVQLYDCNGRFLDAKRSTGAMLSFQVPYSGTYIIKIDDCFVRKVVVIK
jgi:hypothetical protein